MNQNKIIKKEKQINLYDKEIEKYDNELKQIASSNTIGQPVTVNKKPGQKLIPVGTIINCVLDQDVISDYTGPARGLITHDVYDISYNYILIPKGSKVTNQIMKISNINLPIQARLGIISKYVIMPNGTKISFEKNSVLDSAGVNAIKDKVSYHFVAQFLGVAAYALLSNETSREGSGDMKDFTYKGEIGETMRQQFAPLAQRYLGLVPTITLRAGTPFKIFIEEDIYTFPYSSVAKELLNAFM